MTSLSLEGKVLDLRVTGKFSGKLLTPGWWKVQRHDVGEGQEGTTESLTTAHGVPCFPVFSDGYSCTSSGALPFPASQSTALCISVDLFSSLSNFNYSSYLPHHPPHNQLKKNELVSHCFYHFGSKQMLCLACSAPSQKMNQQLLWQKLFSWMGKQRKKENRPGGGVCSGHCQPPITMGNVFALHWGRWRGWRCPPCPQHELVCGWCWMGSDARGCAWESSNGMGWFRESKSDPKLCRLFSKPHFRQAGSVSSYRCTEQETPICELETPLCPCMALWHGGVCAQPWEKDELFLCVWMDLDHIELF